MVRLGLSILFFILMIGTADVPLVPARALVQVDPAVLARVVPAAVQIAIISEVTDQAGTSETYIPVASGTVVSADGLVLTNAHAVGMTAHRDQLNLWEEQAASQSAPVSFELDAQHLLILGTEGSEPPTPRYVATILVQDATMDLAVLQIVADAFGSVIDPGSLSLPFVPLGDSEAVRRGEPLDILSYPIAGGDSLTYTTGVVSGFNQDEGSSRATWITTDAELSGGSSGGTAVNRRGELIGIPTQGSELDCRPGDTNRDGVITAEDIGCIPVGGSIALLRPSNSARDLLARVGLTQRVMTSPVDSGDTPSVNSGYTPIEGSRVPTPVSAEASVSTTTVVASAPMFSEAETALCATGAVYEVGTGLIAGRGDDAALLGVSLANYENQYLPPGSIVRTTGPFVEAGQCDLWPVEVVLVQHPRRGVFIQGDPVSPTLISGPGTRGLIDERWVRKAPEWSLADPDGDGRYSSVVKCVTSEPEPLPGTVFRYGPQDRLDPVGDDHPCDPTR